MKWLSLSVVVFILDQLSKMVATQNLQLHQANNLFPGFNLTLMHNTGAAFSMLSQAGGWQRWLFILIALSVSVFIAVWLVKLPAQKRWFACALALILGGALGNVFDRIFLGYVIDFIDVYVNNWHWPAFNIADSAISIGAVMVIIDAIWFTGNNPDEKNSHN